MATKDNKIPEGSFVREDGCICPSDSQKPVCDTRDVCPYDPRFPNANQTMRCYFSFLDYQRCARLLGDYPGCKIFYVCYTSLCPRSWYEKWYEQMLNGTFPRRIYPPSPIIIPDRNKMGRICLEGEEEEEPDIC